MRLIETEIEQLKLKMLDMAELVQMQFDNMSVALTQMDHELANKIRKREADINKYDNKIDKRCSRILALHQPVANDLRFIFSVVKVNSSLEKIGDLINNSARTTLSIDAPFESDFIAELRLEEMCHRTSHLMTTALKAFFSEDADTARTIFELDDAIDEINGRAFEIITLRIQTEPHRAAELVKLLLLVKNIEKIADFAASISKETIFLVDAVVVKPHKLKRVEVPARGDSDAPLNS